MYFKLELEVFGSDMRENILKIRIVKVKLEIMIEGCCVSMYSKSKIAAHLPGLDEMCHNAMR